MFNKRLCFRPPQEGGEEVIVSAWSHKATAFAVTSQAETTDTSPPEAKHTVSDDNMSSPRMRRKKLVVVGDAGTGKTRLLSAVVGEAFESAYRPTVMEDRAAAFETRGEGGEEVRLRVDMADTSGDEDYDRLRPLSYLDSDLILLCFSLSSPSSLKSASDRWRSELRHLLPAVPVLLVGTKADLREEAMRRERKERRREERRKRRREEEGAETNSSGGSNASTSATSEATATVPPAMEVDGGEEEEENQKSYVETDRGRLLCWHLGAECYVECSSKSGAGIQALREAAFDALLERGSRGRRNWRRAAKMVRM